MNINSSTRQYSQTARAKAAEETGQRIVDAFVQRLMTQWYDEITLDRIAEDAGVTVQTVVRRFGGKEGLLVDAVNVLAQQIHETRATQPGDVEQLVGHLIADYELTGDAIIRLLALEARHPALKEFLDRGRKWHRDWVAGRFEDELARLETASRKRALDALVITTDVYTWKLLRRDMVRSVAATKTIMNRMIRAAMAEFLTPQSSGE